MDTGAGILMHISQAVLYHAVCRPAISFMWASKVYLAPAAPILMFKPPVLNRGILVAVLALNTMYIFLHENTYLYHIVKNCHLFSPFEASSYSCICI